MTTTSVTGRRERKKEATRTALADAALRLFIAHGYDNVTLRDIADAADVSTTTLMNYFPSKEALVFDKDANLEAELLAAVTDRPAGVSIPRALHRYIASTLANALTAPGRNNFVQLVLNTPALGDYEHKMWTRHQNALARAIARDIGANDDNPRCAALARFTLETRELAARSGDPVGSVDAAFDLLENGW